MQYIIDDVLDVLSESTSDSLYNEYPELFSENTYDPPYTKDEILQNYGKETLDQLLKDPAHKWRMDTGIELIHREPSLTELKRIMCNWNKMTPEQKEKSDKKSIELFGKTNKENYDELVTLYESVNTDESRSTKTFYHLSKREKTKLIPKVYNSDFEDQTTPRVCVSSSIQGCLIGINEDKDITGKIFHVYEVTSNNWYVPSTKEVADCKLTGEVWILEECIPNHVFDIKITGIKSYKKWKFNGNEFKVPIWKYVKV